MHYGTNDRTLRDSSGSNTNGGLKGAAAVVSAIMPLLESGSSTNRPRSKRMGMPLPQRPERDRSEGTINLQDLTKRGGHLSDHNTSGSQQR